MKRILSILLLISMLLMCFSVAYAEEEPITMKIMRETRNIWYPEGEDDYKNVLIDFMEEQLGCKFDIAWAIDNGAYEAQINMLISSNDLPDVFYASTGQMETLYEYGMIQPIGQYFDEYCTEEALSHLHYNHDAFMVGCTFDGEFYGFPCTDDFMGNMPMLFIRQDWLDNLNMSFDPDNFTMEDLEAICDAFTNGDPDGNGVKDTYAFGFDGEAVNSIQMKALAHGLGLYTNMWTENESGELEYTDIKEDTKALLELLQKWYEKGYIPQDYVSKSYWTEGTTELSSGQYGIFVGYFWSGLGAPETAIQADPNINFVVYPCPRNPEGEYKLQTNVTISRYLVVKTGYEHPELAVKYMQLWYDMWRGVHAEYYHGLNGDAYAAAEEDFKFYVPFWWDPALKNLAISNKIMKALDGDESEIKEDAEGYKQWLHIQEWLAGKPDYYGFAQYYNFVWSDQIVERLYGADEASNYVTNLASVIPVDSELAGIKSLLSDLHMEYFNKIIMGADLDSTFTEYVEQWHSTGGDELAEYYNDWYAANGELFK